MRPIHMRANWHPRQALHFLWPGFKSDQLTDDKEQVTCRICLRMLKRAERYDKDK